MRDLAARWLRLWQSESAESPDFVGTLREAFPDFSATLDDLVIDTGASRASIRWSATGTHRGGPYLGFPPTGRLIRFRGIEIIRVAEGRIAERWGEWDAQGLLDQLRAATLSLDHVQIAAPPGAEPAARAFYGGVLGLPELAKPESLAANGGCWFAAGALQIHIGIETDFRPARKAHVALRVADAAALEGIHGRLPGAKWDARQPGVRRFFAEDPWGNRLEFLAYDA